MLYDVYQKRIQKIAEFLSKLIKLLPIIASAVSVVLLTTVVLLACKGIPGKVDCPSEIIYGDLYNCEAGAFLSDVRIEYSAEGSEEWSGNKPHLPGDYLVRAVGISVFDNDRYGKTTEFSIMPRPVDVKVKNNSVVYGETPEVISETVYTDKFVCSKVIFESTSQAITKVKPDITDVKFYDADGNDISYAYVVNIVQTDLNFERRPITVTVDSASKEYDDTPLELDAYALTEGTLAFSDSLGAVFSASITDVGSVDNTPVFQILQNEKGNAVNVTDLYSINIIKGTLTVVPRVLKINTGSFQSIYTAGEISCKEFEIDPTAIPLDGHTVTLISSQSYTDCGTYKNKQIFSVTDTKGNDKTQNYSIYYLEGDITIIPKDLQITTFDNEWVYDGKTHPNYDIKADGLITGHLAYPAPTQTTISDVGSAENKITVSISDREGKNVTANYNISYKYGTLTVTPRPITIKTYDGSWVYDGTAHYSRKYDLLSELGFADGHSLEPIETSTITDAGRQTNLFSVYQIKDSSGNDKTFCYTVTFKNGTLEVLKRPITVKPADTEKIYDGTPLYGGEIDIHSSSSKYSIVAGQIMTATASGSQTDAGTSASGLASITIKAGDRDVTNNYIVETVNGKITVHKRPIIILTGSAEKDYDGKPLTCNTFSISLNSKYQLVVGHKITMKLTGSQTKIGESPNTYNETGTKITAQNKDVTKNYSIKYELGTLKVNPYAVISIITNSDKKLYDGTPLTNNGYEAVIVRGNLKNGHKISVDVFGSITDPGIAPNEAIAKIVDSNGKNVSASYELDLSFGDLEIIDGQQEDSNMVFGQIKTDKGGTVYLYMNSYGNYNGKQWSKGINYGKTLPGGYSYNYLTSIALHNTGNETAFAEIKDCSLFMLPYYIGFNGDYEIQKSDVSYTGKASNYNMEYYYSVSGLNGYDSLKGNLGEYAKYEEEYRKFVYKNYLTVDDVTAEYMNALIAKNNFSLSDPNVIQRIATYIQHAAVYSLDYDPLMDVEENVVIAFLDKYKEGKCVHYASAATLLYRTLGIPARYVTGWMIDTVKDQYVDIANPGHAWVEVYIDGVGWVQVEVTGSSNEVGGTGGSGGPLKPTITIQPKYTYGTYSGKAIVAQNSLEADSLLAELLQKGYTYTVSVSGSLINPGRTESKVTSFELLDPTGKDVTSYFNYSYQPGTIEVFSRSTEIIKVYLYELQKFYDGSPLSFGDEDYAIIEMKDGLALKLKLNISLTNAETMTLSTINVNRDLYASYSVYQGNKDITSDCVVVFDTFAHTPSYYIPININPRPIEISSATEFKVEDGEPLYNNKVSVTYSSLIEGHTIEATAIGFIDYPGTVKNDIFPFISITDAQGNDVTDNYSIQIGSIGELTIIEKDE